MQSARTQLLEQIQTVIPFDLLENRDIEDVIEWIKGDAQIFRIEKPDKPPKHLVSYFVLVDREKKSILLTDHIKAQHWLPPAGHVWIDEDPKSTVERRSVEELGINAIFLGNRASPFFVTVTPMASQGGGHTDVCLWYLLEGRTDQELKYDAEQFKGVRWFTIDEILATPLLELNPELHRFARKLSGSYF